MESVKCDKERTVNDILKKIDHGEVCNLLEKTENDNFQNKNEFTSCITSYKRPILPPVITSLDRSEMAFYRELAVNIEKRKRSHSNAIKRKITPCSMSVNEKERDRPNDSSATDAGSVIRNQSCVEMSYSPLTSFASTDLAKYMNTDINADDNCNSSCDENTDVQVSIIQNGISEETMTDQNDTEIEEGSEIKIDDTSTTPKLRKSSYTLDQPSPALMTYLKNLNINSEINAEGSPNQLEVVFLNQNESLNAEIPNQVPLNSSTFERESIFKDLFLKFRQDNGLNETIAQQKDLENLVKEHDEALQNLKNNFLKAASNLFTSSCKTSNNQVPIALLPKIEVENNCSTLSTIPDATVKSNVKNVDVAKFNIGQFKRTQVTPHFDRVSAAVKGYLTRRLLRTQKVQAIVKTIKDTLEFAFELHSDSPIKDGCVTPQDAELHERLLAQLSSACFEIHDIFFKTTIKERMDLIAQDRVILKEKYYKEFDVANANSDERFKHRKLSSATIKAMDRRKRRTIDSRNSMSPRSWNISKFKSPRESPIKGQICKNVASEIRRSLTSSPLNSVSSYQYVEQRSLSAMSENVASLRHARRNLNYAKKPVVRKINIKLNSVV